MYNLQESKSSKDAPLTQSANTQIAPEVEAKPAKTRKSKSKARKKKAAAQAKNLANLAGASDENIKNMILIQQKSKLRLKKVCDVSFLLITLAPSNHVRLISFDPAK